MLNLNFSSYFPIFDLLDLLPITIPCAVPCQRLLPLSTENFILHLSQHPLHPPPMSAAWPDDGIGR